MFKNRKIKVLFPIILLALTAAVILGTVAILPQDAPATEPPTGYGNQLNGGTVAKSGSMLYYVNGESVLYCLSSPNSYRIDEMVGSLLPYGNGLVYRRQSGEVIYCNYNGDGKKVLLKGVDLLTLSGNWLFFTRDGGEVYKRSLLDGKEYSLGIVAQQFMVASNAILYINEDGYLYTARCDGTNVEKFFDEKVDRFMRYESYIFYTRDGMLYSVASGNAASKFTYFPVEDFNITEDSVLVFTDENGLNTYDLKAEKPKVRQIEIQGSVAYRPCVWGEYILYYNDEAQLIRCLKDGSEWIYM